MSDFVEYKPMDVEHNVKAAVENLRKAYWSNDTEKVAKIFTEAEGIIVSAICHDTYTVCKPDEERPHEPKNNCFGCQGDKDFGCEDCLNKPKGDLISRSDALKAVDTRHEELLHDTEYRRKHCQIDLLGIKKHILAIPSAPERPKGEWIRKEDVIHSIAKQYSEHNELVPVWLSIGDIKGGAE